MVYYHSLFLPMSNQSTELQKKEETKQSFIEKTASDTISKTISTLVAGGIITVLSILVAIIYGLPYYLYLPLGALVFFLVALGWYVISFRPTNKRLIAEIESLKNGKEAHSNEKETPLLENPEDKKEITRLSKELEEEKTLRQRAEEKNKRDNKSTQESHNRELEWRDEKLNKNQWLFSLAEYQAHNIEECVVVASPYVKHTQLSTQQGFTEISFIMRVSNKSVYDIMLEGKTDGEIFFNTMCLHHDNRIESPLQIIKPNTEVEVEISQRLSKLEVEGIKEAKEQYKKDKKVEPTFYFDKLKITIKGSERFPQIKPRPLVIWREVKAVLTDPSTVLGKA